MSRGPHSTHGRSGKPTAGVAGASNLVHWRSCPASQEDPPMDTTKHAAPLRYPTITLVCAALWLCGLLATAAGAQAPAGPIPPKADSQVQQPPPKSGIRVNVALVNT